MCNTVKKGDTLTLLIESVNNMGNGVAHAPDGRAVFVAGAVTGDKIEATVIKVNKSWAVAKRTALLVPSPYREEGFCAAPDSCGGCVYRYISYERELELKREYVDHAFRKAGLSAVVEKVRTTGEVSRYRNKAEYPIAKDKNGLYGGFYAPRTHRVVKAMDCSLQPAVFGEILRFFCDFYTKRGVEAYCEETGKGLLRHLYLRTGRGSGELLVCPVINGTSLPDGETFVKELLSHFPAVTSILLNVNRENTNVVLGKEFRTLFGKSVMTDTLCGLSFDIAPGAFYQVNHDAAELLYSIAAEKASPVGALLLDLYCGAGTIGLSMADKTEKLVGIEIQSEAVKSAKQNAAQNGITNAAFYCGDAAGAEKLLESAEKELGQLHPTTVILDPPRRGCDERLLKFLSDRGVPRIVYVSCNPDSLARDTALLVSLGYTLGTVTPVDLFPRTGHVESVVCLTRSDKAT